jgi:hypothetical protein
VTTTSWDDAKVILPNQVLEAVRLKVTVTLSAFNSTSRAFPGPTLVSKFRQHNRLDQLRCGRHSKVPRHLEGGGASPELCASALILAPPI